MFNLFTRATGGTRVQKIIGQFENLYQDITDGLIVLEQEHTGVSAEIADLSAKKQTLLDQQAKALKLREGISRLLS